MHLRLGMNAQPEVNVVPGPASRPPVEHHPAEAIERTAEGAGDLMVFITVLLMVAVGAAILGFLIYLARRAGTRGPQV
jgi:hypothetical protein